MSNKHHPVNKDFELDLKLKVHVETVSCFTNLTEQEIEQIVSKRLETLKRDILHAIQNSDDVAYDNVEIHKIAFSTVTLHIDEA